MEKLIGKTIAKRYLIKDILGSGGMGSIFLAADKRSDTDVVLKNLQSIKKTEVNIKRFKKEAEILKKLKHPNIVSYIDYITWDDELYIILEYLNGISLQEKLKSKKRMNIGEITDLFVQIIDALETAHSEQIVHRDLKPSNIFCIPREFSTDLIKLLDFGISISLSEGPESRLTRTGEIVGTPYYLSPEHITRDREISFPSDIYSLGVIMYEVLAGFPPFSGQNDMDVLMGHLYRQPNLIQRPDLENEPMYKKILQITYRSLKKNANERMGSVREIREFFESTTDQSSSKQSNIIKDRVTRHRQSFRKPSGKNSHGEITRKMAFNLDSPDETLGIPPLFKSGNKVILFEDHKASINASLIPLLNVSNIAFKVFTGSVESILNEDPPPHLIILNEGDDANQEKLKQIRSDENLMNIPVIPCGDENDMESISSAIGAGATDYFPIPFNPDDIAGKLKKYTGGSEN